VGDVVAAVVAVRVVVAAVVVATVVVVAVVVKIVVVIFCEKKEQPERIRQAQISRRNKILFISGYNSIRKR
jgi:hypothetical protein